MPGLFDNNNGPGGILSGLGNFFGGIGAAMNPAIQENQFRQQAAQALARQNGPDDAAIMMGNLPAYGLGFQRELFLKQLQDLQQTNPGISLNEALYRMSPEGQKGQFGVQPLPGFKAGGYESVGTFGPNGQVHAPQGFSGGTTGVQGQPSQQPSDLPPVMNSMLEYERQLAANKAKGEEEGAAQTTVGGTVAQIDRSLALIDDISKDPNMKWATGLFGAIPPVPGTGPYGFSKKVDQLKEQLTLDLLPSLQRKGSRVSPALTEMLQKSTAGQELDRASPDFPKSLESTRNALMQIRAATQGQANVPVTQAPAQEAESYEGRTVTNKKTGQKGIIKNGQLVPLPQGPQL